MRSKDWAGAGSRPGRSPQKALEAGGRASVGRGLPWFCWLPDQGSKPLTAFSRALRLESS